MKRGVIIIFLCSIGVMEITGAPTQKHGPITPKLTMVASVDGKSFYLDRTTMRTQAEALTYCATLGMRLAEITSAEQFSALDQAVVEEWAEGSAAWTGGVETRGILRYAWENSNVGLDPSYIPYSQYVTEGSNYFVYFSKRSNGSVLRNSPPTKSFTATLCETL